MWSIGRTADETCHYHWNQRRQRNPPKSLACLLIEQGNLQTRTSNAKFGRLPGLLETKVVILRKWLRVKKSQTLGGRILGRGENFSVLDQELNSIGFVGKRAVDTCLTKKASRAPRIGRGFPGSHCLSMQLAEIIVDSRMTMLDCISSPTSHWLTNPVLSTSSQGASYFFKLTTRRRKRMQTRQQAAPWFHR